MTSPARLVRLVVAVTLGFALTAVAIAQEKPDTRRKPWTTSRLKGSPETPEPYRIAPAFAQLKFQRPTSIEELPGTGRLLVTEMGGKVWSFPKEGNPASADLVGSLPAGVSLFDAEPHPKFSENHYLFLCYVHPGTRDNLGRQTRVSRFTMTAASPPTLAAESEVVIITWPSGGHNGGCLEFGKDGQLYISTGDGSGPNPPDGLTTGQDVSDLLGAILRIDVDHPKGDQQYSVPADNPFVGMKDARPEIWAYGLRNPWKFGIDPASGDIFAADNGWESWEMVHRIVRGGNCGWPIMEGRAALRSEVKPGPTPILPPVQDHPHTEANSVIGGPVYRGSKLPGLVGSFLYGDYITGTIWAIKPDKDGNYAHTTLCDTDLQIVAFTQGSGGEVWVLDYDFTGQIYELLLNDVPDTSATFPRRLSETGLFSSLDKMEPAPGVVPYTVRVNQWADGATAQRWVAIPGQERISLVSGKDESGIYPEGTVFVKQLSLPQGGDRPAIRLETQILHFERGSWRPYSYLWDEDGKDAQLVPATGADRTLKVSHPLVKEGLAERTWHVSAVNECKLCHNAGARNVLGFIPTQLDQLLGPGNSHGATQMTHLDAIGVLAKPPAVADDDPTRLVDPRDASQKLDDRARSYLAVNCSMCHHPRGNAIVSFYLKREMPFEQLNMNKGTGIGTFGMQNAWLIVPGDPYRSVLFYRMSKLGYARMPYIGSRVVDSDGIALVEEWIRSLSGRTPGPSSPVLAKDSPEAKALETLSDKSASPEKHAQAIGNLTKSTSGALALAALAHRGALNAADYEAAVTAGSQTSASDIRGLFETFVPEGKRRPTLGPTIDPQVILSKPGDLARGKLIYFSDGARCRNCHEVSDKSQSVGPTLLEINKKYPKPAEMLQHVLQPSLKIDEPFAVYTLLTTDGRLLTGLIDSQTDQEVVLRTAEKKILRLPRAQIEELKRSPKSLMPDQILSDLTAQEAADLLEYLRSLGATK